MTASRECPCGSDASYADCCGALHRGRACGAPTAATAEALMRSRFSAFAVGDVDYLLATWHPTSRPRDLTLDPNLEWRRLKIVGTTAGREDDDAGTVAFVAHYWDAGERHYGRQDEDSRFVREDGQWFYIGVTATRSAASSTA